MEIKDMRDTTKNIWSQAPNDSWRDPHRLGKTVLAKTAYGYVATFEVSDLFMLETVTTLLREVLHEGSPKQKL